MCDTPGRLSGYIVGPPCFGLQGEEGQEYPFLTDSELFAALETADRCFRDEWRKRLIAEHARIAGRAAEILHEKRDEYQGYLTFEMGKMTRFGYMEVDLAAECRTHEARTERTLARVGSI